MPDPNNGTAPDNPGSADFLLGQMSQSITSLHEEVAHLRADFKRASENFATRPELEQVKADVAALEEFQQQTVKDTASRKWIDRAIIGGIATAATTIGGGVATILINPLILP